MEWKSSPTCQSAKLQGLIDSGVWRGGVNTEFNLTSHNTPTCPENVDSLIGFTEPKKQDPNSALMYRERIVAIRPCELDRGLGDEAIISHRGLIVKCEYQAVYVRGRICCL